MDLVTKYEHEIHQYNFSMRNGSYIYCALLTPTTALMQLFTEKMLSWSADFEIFWTISCRVKILSTLWKIGLLSLLSGPLVWPSQGCK